MKVTKDLESFISNLKKKKNRKTVNINEQPHIINKIRINSLFLIVSKVIGKMVF